MTEGITSPAPAGRTGRRRDGRLLSRAATSRAVAVVAAASAVAGLLAPGAPTGVAGFDGLLRAATAGLVALAASRGRRWSWVTAAGAVAVGGAVSGELTWSILVACVSLGLATYSAFGDRRHRLVGAVTGALTIQAGLRLPHHPTGVSAVAAGVAAVLLVVSGVRTLRRRQRRIAYASAFALGVAAVAATVLGAVALLTARPQAAAGLAAANAGLAAAGGADTTQAVTDLQTAEAGFGSTARELSAWYAKPARLVPVLAQNIRALATLADQGVSVLQPAITLAQAGSSQGLYGHGEVNLAAVAALSKPLAASRATLDEASSRLAAIRSDWDLPPVSSKIDTFSSKAAKVTGEEAKLTDAVTSLPGLLGGEGMRHYLILVQDPSELRGAGGVVGDVGVLSADNGRIHLDSLQPAYSGPYSSGLAGPLAIWADRSGFSPQKFSVDSTFTPDFPTDAQGAEQIFELPGQPRFDGVISVDPTAIAGLLQVTGPVTVPGWPVPLTSANVEAVFLHDQYQAYSGQQRLDFLVSAARTIFDKFTAADLANPSQLVRALTPAARQGDLMLYANKATEQQTFSTLGVTGAMGPVNGDWLEVVTQDGGNDKVDYYLTRSMAYEPRYDPATGRVDATLTVTLHNAAPASGQPDYVIGGPGFRTSGGNNHLYVTVYSPLRVDKATVGGTPLSLGQDFELGRYAYSGYVDIPAGETRTVTYHLAGSISPGPQYRLTFAKQPTVNPDQMSVIVSAPSGWRPDRPGSFSTVSRTSSNVNAGFTRR
ncbi:MAG TPA: DUF4012 domain-containing protein [Acidimicrobiales bacterium]|nr:DUF4012 domain-containing protein [Acidimicrobiales bacterium]